MTQGAINLTIGEIQAHLRKLLESEVDLTPEQRYSLVAAIEAMGFIKKVAPGLQKVLHGRKNIGNEGKGT